MYSDDFLLRTSTAPERPVSPSKVWTLYGFTKVCRISTWISINVGQTKQSEDTTNSSESCDEHYFLSSPNISQSKKAVHSYCFNLASLSLTLYLINLIYSMCIYTSTCCLIPLPPHLQTHPVGPTDFTLLWLNGAQWPHIFDVVGASEWPHQMFGEGVWLCLTLCLM